mmetsp:Transcript_14025/g.28058  ORF Transcript_14025/g.28058 Transcript_14025/m.28058 type:complete len:110 (-) Transcript_14025:198-527(-)
MDKKKGIRGEERQTEHNSLPPYKSNQTNQRVGEERRGEKGKPGTKEKETKETCQEDLPSCLFAHRGCTLSPTPPSFSVCPHNRLASHPRNPHTDTNTYDKTSRQTTKDK